MKSGILVSLCSENRITVSTLAEMPQPNVPYLTLPPQKTNNRRRGRDLRRLLRSSAERSSVDTGIPCLHIQRDLLFLGCQAKLVQCSGFDLADPLFGDAKLRANFFQRAWFLRVIEAKAADNDLTFAVIETL